MKYKNMKTCPNCGNKIRNEAKYCDQCKTYLKLSNPEITYNPKKYKEMQSLKETLLESTPLVKEREDGSNYAEIKIEYYYETILSYLFESTNLEEKLKSQNISEINFFYPLMNILKNLKKTPKEDILDEFLYQINQKYQECKKKEEKTIKFIFYTNIKLKSKDYEIFKELVEVFDLKIFDYNDFKFETKDIDEKQAFKSKYIMLEYTTTGKDWDLLEKEALNQIYLFYGYLTLIHKFRRGTEHYHINHISLNHNISDLNISSIIHLNEDNTFINFYISQGIIENENKLNKSKFINFKEARIPINFYENIKSGKNKKLMHNINEYLILYYLASKEKDLENSFIKFWSLSEKIIKRIGGQMKDSALLKNMIKILKMIQIPKYIQIRLEFIKKKRNQLVHENKNNINRNDRDIAKLVADGLIIFLMAEIDTVRNMEEYKLILDAYNENNNRKIKLLTQIEKRKNN